MAGLFCLCPRIRLNAGSWIALCTVAILKFFNMIIKITFCLHMGNLGLCTAASSGEVGSDFLQSRICAPGSAERRGFLLPQVLADALQVDAVSSAPVLMQPHVLSTPCPPLLGHACENVSLANEFCFAPFCPPFLHVRVK